MLILPRKKRFRLLHNTALAAGLVNNGATNLLTNAQAFDNAAWQKLNATATANTQVAPDGTTTADTLTSSSTSTTYCYQTPSVNASTTYTFSVFAKQGTAAFLTMDIDDGGDKRNWFNLATGAIGTSAIGTPATKTLPNGWFEFSVTYTATVTGSKVFAFGVADANGGVVPTAGVTAYLWQGQLVTGGTIGPIDYV